MQLNAQNLISTAEINTHTKLHLHLHKKIVTWWNNGKSRFVWLMLVFIRCLGLKHHSWPCSFTAGCLGTIFFGYNFLLCLKALLRSMSFSFLIVYHEHKYYHIWIRKANILILSVRYTVKYFHLDTVHIWCCIYIEP